jgi:23S rRNA pseudouridine2605 synthase
LIRINKYLSICGVTSRRGADQLISRGRVAVNNVTVKTRGTIINESEDIVKVDGTEVKPVETQIYILLNKPKYVLTTLFDPFRRKTVAHYVRNLKIRVYPVGRLDYDTDGVLLMTNDGELAYRLAHPKYQVKKVYRAFVSGAFSAENAKAIERGIKLADGHLAKAGVSILSSGLRNSKISLVLAEGHKHEIKQLLKAVGHPVRDLNRTEFAGLKGDQLRPGRWRYLNPSEIKALKKLVGL